MPIGVPRAGGSPMGGPMGGLIPGGGAIMPGTGKHRHDQEKQEHGNPRRAERAATPARSPHWRPGEGASVPSCCACAALLSDPPGATHPRFSSVPYLEGVLPGPQGWGACPAPGGTVWGLQQCWPWPPRRQPLRCLVPVGSSPGEDAKTPVRLVLLPRTDHGQGHGDTGTRGHALAAAPTPTPTARPRPPWTTLLAPPEGPPPRAPPLALGASPKAAHLSLAPHLLGGSPYPADRACQPRWSLWDRNASGHASASCPANPRASCRPGQGHASDASLKPGRTAASKDQHRGFPTTSQPGSQRARTARSCRTGPFMGSPARREGRVHRRREVRGTGA